MTRQEILVELTNFLQSNFPSIHVLDKLDADQSLIETGIIDSFGIVEIAGFIEKNWSMKIFDYEIKRKNFSTINQIVEFVTKKMTSEKF